MEANTEKVKQTKKLQLLAVFAVILIISSGLIALYFENFGNSPHVGSVTRVACVGDSITEGFGYPDKLGKMLGNNYTVGNFGVGGSTVLLSSGKSYINQFAMQRAKEYQPDIVVIMLGTNDAVPAYYQHIEKFVNDYKTLIGEFEALASKPKIWLVKPPPIFNDDFGPNNEKLVQGVIPRIDQVANDLGLPIIDLYAPLLNHPEYLFDGIHPNKEAVQIITREVYKTIYPSTPQG